jgi:hypothetical protein
MENGFGIPVHRRYRWMGSLGNNVQQAGYQDPLRFRRVQLFRKQSLTGLCS